MSLAKSQAQLQREYRERLKRKYPELLRARDHEKYRRRCLKRNMLTTMHNFDQRNNHKNASVGGIKQEGSVRRPYVEASHHDRASPVGGELWQREIPTRHDSSRVADKSCARKLYLIDENAYRNLVQRDAIAETVEKRPVAEGGLISRLENSESEHKTKSVNTDASPATNDFMRITSASKYTDSSPTTNDYRHITPSPEDACMKVMKHVKTTRKPSCKKVVEKKNQRNTNRKHVRKAKRKTVPIQWDPILF